MAHMKCHRDLDVAGWKFKGVFVYEKFLQNEQQSGLEFSRLESWSGDVW